MELIKQQPTMNPMTVTFYQNKTTGKYISKLRIGNEVIEEREYDTYQKAYLSYLSFQADGHIPSY